MQILAAEIDLREATRVAEQAKPALEIEKFEEQANGLSGQQDDLRIRCEKLVDRIQELKDAEELFGKEIALLSKVATVMDEATLILAEPETGAKAIAAETEVIELLLQSKRINPKGGGGGGSSPGGGGGGTTSDTAIALVGKGVNPREKRSRRAVRQATGQTKSRLPEEYRTGLDEYFNRIVEPAG